MRLEWSALSSLKNAWQIHAQLLVAGALSHSPSTTCLLKCLTEASAAPLSYVLDFFSGIPALSTFQWNTIIRACSACHFPRESLHLFHKMRRKSAASDAYTFQFLFKSCGLAGSDLEGQMVHALFVKHFPNCNAFIVNSLVYMYVQLDCIDDAMKVFRSIDMKDVVSWKTIIGGLVKSRSVDDARKMFNEMPVRNVVSWTSLIAGYAKDGRASEAVGMFKEMMSENVEPDAIAMVAVLTACAQLRDLKMGKWLHQIVIDKRIGVSSNLAVALIDMYAKGGSIEYARQTFDSMNNKIVPAWNAIIDGYCKIGDVNIGRSLFEKMVAPDIISFNSMITGYVHGRNDWSSFVISRMSEDFIATELCDDDEINRAIMWKKGRVNKEANFEGEDLTERVQKIFTKLSYSQEEIDEVRSVLTECIQDHIYE